MKRVHLVDYGVGNLYSIARAVEAVGGELVLSSDRRELATADRMILPGVGAFKDGMAGLVQSGLDEAVRTHAEVGRPLLGICLGMQMLMDESLEFGEHRGLSLVPGRVVPIPTGEGDNRRKVPYVGWAELEPARADGFAETALCNLADDAVYLVHSYYVEPADPQDTLAVYCDGDAQITAAIQRDNILGCQFHPEKSGEAGLGILAEFLKA
jgi:glutamine amidotransferase